MKLHKLFKLLILIFFTAKNVKGQQENLIDENVGNGITFTKAVGILSDNLGRLYVWEQDGKVWVVNNGVKSPTPMIDLSLEVFPSVQMGLIGMVLDPDFTSNGLFYLYYSVDVYWEQNYGQPGYNPALLNGGNAWQPIASFGRLTRYQVNNVTATFPTANLSSRQILIGETLSTGVPVTAYSHIGGAMTFGHDGSLIVCTGDGGANGDDVTGDVGNYYFSDYQGALSKGIMTPAENIGMYRSQYENSLCGKVLRINPANGNGYPSNPNYENAFPRSAKSRTFANGLRNPFHVVWFDESGSHDLEDGNPGSFVISEVGRDHFDELNVLTNANQNFGWPTYEGNSRTSPWANMSYPINNYKRPTIAYRNSVGTSEKNGLVVNIGGSQIPGPLIISGSCIAGGIFMEKEDFPEKYNGAYFWTDYDARQIYVSWFNENFELDSMQMFYQVPGKITHLTTSPTDAGLFYLDNAGGINSVLKRIRYQSGNKNPIAKIFADKVSVNNGESISFDALNAYDPEGDPLEYLWDFGNGVFQNNDATVVKTFQSANPVIFKVRLKVKDSFQNEGLDSVFIHVNYSPPIILSTSIDAIHIIGNSSIPVTLTANVSDQDTPLNQLIYNWVIVLCHDGHEHIASNTNGNNLAYTFGPIECEAGNATYWHRVYLKVTDPEGQEAKFIKDIYPDCGGVSQQITFPELSDYTISTSQITLNATSTSGLPIAFYAIEGPVNLLGNLLKFNGHPGFVKIRATQKGNSTYDPAVIVERSFRIKNVPSQLVRAGSLSYSMTNLSDGILNWQLPDTSFSSIELYINGAKTTLSGNRRFQNLNSLNPGNQYKFYVKGIVSDSYVVNTPELIVELPSQITNCGSADTFISDINWTSATSAYGTVKKNLSFDQNPLRIGGHQYAKGLGVHAPSVVKYAVNQGYERFKAEIGIDDEVDNSNCGSVVFKIFNEGVANPIYTSPELNYNALPLPVDINISAVNTLRLEVYIGNGGDVCDHADWANARLGSCNIADKLAPDQPDIISTISGSGNFQLNWVPVIDDSSVTYKLFINNTFISTLSAGILPSVVSGVSLNSNDMLVIQAIDNTGNTTNSEPYFFSNQCPETVVLQSLFNDFLDGQTHEIKSSDQIISTGKVGIGSTLILNAAKKILLDPGFEVNQGSIFQTKLEGCN